MSVVRGVIFLFQAEDGIRDLVRSRGLGDVYKRQLDENGDGLPIGETGIPAVTITLTVAGPGPACPGPCLLYTSDAADERSSVDLGGRRIIKKKTRQSRDTS